MPIFVLLPKVCSFLLSLSQSDGGLELLLDLDGSHSGWVEARTHCDHLPAAVSPSDADRVPPPASPCTRSIPSSFFLSVVTHSEIVLVRKLDLINTPRSSFYLKSVN